ncbi:MAG: hypothetical protein EP329_22650 [Deltaproteobacteria bacterium]|nr:MAG: hypothetical protein EP329_22650 [Deltaproteobacteria bacterium]
MNTTPKALAVTALAASFALLAACSSPGGGTLPGDTAGGDVSFGGDSVVGPQDTTTTSLCQGNDGCAAPTPYCSPTGICVQCLQDEQCSAGHCTAAGLCVSDSCTPGQATCNGNTLLTCNAQGTDWDALVCSGGCADGSCVGCTPNERVCNGNTVLQCNAGGTGFDPNQVCQDDEQCVNGQCVTCYPGAKRCNESGQAEVCSAQGVWGVSDDCPTQGLNCLQGACLSPCITDIKTKSNSGCDYWAVDLDNHYDAQNGPFAVIISNLSARVATITITAKTTAAGEATQVAQKDVQPGQLEIFNLPQHNMGSPGIYWSAYRIQASAPIIAYQFNPLDNVDVFSNDASLLLPTNTYGREYIAVSRFELIGGGPNGTELPYRGSISVVAANADTTVQVTPSLRTQAGASMATMQAGQTYTYTLQPFQVLNIKSDQNEGDLTGTVITADKDIAVFGGHEAAVSSTVCCADHLEQQLFPVETWGKSYVAAKSYKRQVEKDYWRVLASEDGTAVSFNPAVQLPRTMNRGESYEFSTDADFVINSDKPVLVSQVLASASEVVNPPAFSDCLSAAQCAPGYQCGTPDGFTYLCLPPMCTQGSTSCPAGHACTCFVGGCECRAVGDPALILTPPVDQYRDEYVFLTPNKYQDDYITVIAPADATVTLDNAPIASGSFTAISGASWRIARLKVSDGVHHITATAPVGVIVYGYDRDVSYGYPAGLNLTDLPQ